MKLSDFSVCAEKLLVGLKQQFEKQFAPEEFVLSSQCIATIRLVECSLKNVQLDTSSAPSENASAAAAVNSIPMRMLLVIAIKVLLYGSLFAAVAGAAPALLTLPLIGVSVFVDVASWIAFQRRKADDPVFINKPTRTPSLVVDSDQLDLELRQAISLVASLLKQHNIRSAELTTLRDAAKTRSTHVSFDESIRAFQRLVGLAQREHPNLRDLVLDECQAVLEDQGLHAIRHNDSTQIDVDHFDIQSATDPNQRQTIELYPAIFTARDRKLVLRGRIIQPTRT